MNGWVDIVIVAIVAIAALKGFKRGFVSELGGFVAIAVAFFAAFNYRGQFDAAASSTFHLSEGSAHILGMIGFALAAYAVVMAIALLLGRIAKLPIINIGNAAGGALVGALKGAIFVWALLYVALLLPLPNDVRGDLHKSALAQALTEQNVRVDSALVETMPWFVRPLVSPMLAHHRA